MKRVRKPAALLLALVMALTLAACGGKGGSKTNPAVGKYIGETVLSFDEWMPMDDIYDLGENYIELREDGTGCFMLDGDPTEIDWKLDKDGALTLDRDGAICNCTLKDGLITVNDYFGFDLQLTFRKSGGSGTGSTNTGNTDSTELSIDDFAEVYGGDWHGMAGLTDATGAFEELNDTAHEILARLVFDGNGDCQVWLAMYLEGENDFNFIDTYARVVPDDDTGLELRGTFMGGEMQDGILSVDETGALYVSCEVDSDLVDGSISLLANLRHLDDENWTDEDYIPTQTVTSDRATLEVLNETFFTYLGGLNYFTESDAQSKLTYAELKEHIGVDCSEYRYEEEYQRGVYTWYAAEDDACCLSLFFGDNGKLIAAGAYNLSL